MIGVQASRRAAGVVTLLWISSLAGGASAFLAQVLLSRYLGPTLYGKLAAALATVTLFFPVAGLGVGQYWLRVFGLEGWNGNRWLGPSMQVVGLSTAFALVSLAAWSSISGQDPTTRMLLIWLSPLVLSQATIDLVSGRFQLEERYQTLALWQAALPVSRLLVVAVAISIGAEICAIVGGMVGAALLLTVAGAFQLFRMLRGNYALAGHPEQEAHDARHLTSPRLRDVLSGAWPFALSGVFYLAYFQSAVILLEWISGPKAAAIYNVAFVVLAAVYLLPMTIYQKYLMPKLQRWSEHDRKRLLAVYRFGNGCMVATGLFAMALLLLAAPAGVVLVFGAAYAGASRPLLILALGVPIRFLTASVGGVLATRDQMRRKVWCQSAVAVFNISVNAAVIPRFSYVGAAVTTLLSDALLLVLLLIAVQRHIFAESATCGWNLSLRSLGKR